VLNFAVGTRYNKTTTRVILRWLTQRGIVAIPKSVRKESIEENFDIFDFQPRAEGVEAIKALDTKTSSFFDHCDPAMGKWLGERKPAV
jgi:2,5-diketo-D-gluconate reductase A